MAIQFPDFAQVILSGQNAGANLLSAQSNAARNVGEALGGGIGAGLSGIIRRSREKKAAEIIDEAIENKRRYLAGEVADDAEKATLSKLYDVPESEQWTALAARVAPYSAGMSAALSKRGEQARAAEAQQAAIKANLEGDLLKMGGDPQTIKLQNYVKELHSQRSDLAKNGFNSLDTLDLDTATEMLATLGEQISSANAEIGKRLGLDLKPKEKAEPSEGADAEGEAPEGGAPVSRGVKLDAAGKDLAKQKLLELRGITNTADAQAFLDAVRNDPEIPIAVKGVIATWGLPRLEELRKMDKDLQQLDQSERRLQMERGDKAFGHLEGEAVKLQTQLDGLRGILDGWLDKDGKPTAPATFAQAKARLQILDGALKAARVGPGATESDNSLITLLQSAIGLADREELTPEAYQELVGGVVNSLYGQAQAHNRMVDRAAADADTPYLKSRADAVRIDLGKGKPVFAAPTEALKSKSFFGAGEGGKGGNTKDTNSWWNNLTPEQKARMQELAGMGR